MRTFRGGRLAIAAAALVVATAGAANAAGWGGGCGDCGYGYGGCGVADCAPCVPTYQTVERTIMVPTTVWETRTVNVTVCRPEARQRTVVTRRVVPETREITRPVTVSVPERRTREVNYTVMVPEYKEVNRTYTVMVPHQEERQATRIVCRQVPVQQTRTVIRDRGRWETQTTQVPCGYSCDYDCGDCGGGYASRGLFRRASWGGGYGCGGCGDCNPCGPAPCQQQFVTVTRNVWVPNPVEEQVQYTTYRTERTEQPYTYTVTVMRPEQRTRVDRVRVARAETRTRQVSYVEMVSKQVERTFRQVHYRTVEEPRTVNYTVMVPHQEERQVNVAVCRMVPRTITCRVPCYSDCY